MVGRFFDSEMIEGVEFERYSDKYSDDYTNISPGFEIKVKTIIARKTDDGIYSYRSLDYTCAEILLNDDKTVY